MIDDYTIPNSDEYFTWDFKPFEGLIFDDYESMSPLYEMDEVLET